MNFTSLELGQLAEIAASIDVPLNAFLAVIAVESNGVKGEILNGRFEPIIRYEGHYFDKLCDPSVREAARAAKVSSPKAQGIPNPKTQEARWALVQKAAKYDRRAAYASCSYGVGQVMGSHWQKLGYDSIDDFVDEARSGLVGQAEIMAKFIKAFGLDDELRALDWSGFARGYNGSNYKKFSYDTKLADAYRTYGGKETIAPTRNGFLRLGSKGQGVRDLQAMLRLSGFNVTVDGDFGPTTRDAVKAYQESQGLLADGIVGPKTQLALTQVRSVAPQTIGQEKVLDVKGVKEGIATAIVVPGTVTALKDELTNLAAQFTPYPYLGKMVEYLQTGVAIVSIAGLAIGVGYAGWKWWKSRESFTGTYA